MNSDQSFLLNIINIINMLMPLENYKPKCLLFARGNFLDLCISLYKGGWIGLLILQQIKRDLFLEGLNHFNGEERAGCFA